MDEQIVISLKNITKSYKIRANQPNSVREYVLSMLKKGGQTNKLIALSNINLDIYKGEVFGVIGSNGSGKSTLLNLIMESIRPDKGGKVLTTGKIMRLSLGMGMDPNLSARDNIYVNGSLLGLSFKKIGLLFNDIVQFAGLQKFVDVPVKLYSKGMMAKLKFSIAMHADAEIFLLDEFFGGVGDKEFKAKSNKMFEKSILTNNTIVIVSHNLKLIKKYCSRALWLEHGKAMKMGEPKDVVDEYKKSGKLKSKAKW